MSNLYWAFIAGAAAFFVLGTVEHFAFRFVPSVGWFLLPIASPRAFLSLGNFCLLFAIALATGSMMAKQQAKVEPAPEQETGE
jgi:hypothetical protein